MRLPPHLRSSFREAYRASFGQELAVEQADAFAVPLLRVVAAIARVDADVHRSNVDMDLTDPCMDETVCPKS